MADQSMDAVRRVPLSEAAVAERGRELAEKLGVINALREQKKTEAAKLQAEIDERLDECEVLRREILDGQEEKAQGELFAGEAGPASGDPQAPAPAEAAKALATIAERAEATKGGAFDYDASEPVPAPVATQAELSKAGKKGVH